MADRWNRPPPAERYSIERFDPDGEPGRADVLELWAREGAVPAEAAEQRVDEVTFVGTERDEGLVAICTTYLQHDEILRLDFWHYRTFVAAAHRESDLARWLLYATIEHLRERHGSGADVRGAGMLMEIESPILKRHRNEAVWPTTGFTYVGDSPLGAHRRVLFFDGATVPGPEGGGYA